ncbi:TPA: Cu(I)-responsive transcriptional regulator [Klebsiella michiganensis]|nr:Cu(I)-responsive transcriptional regulator [Klebsiella michiganensis]
MNIGDAARLSGVSAKMIRYYEEAGLIPSVSRTAAGYRIYKDVDVYKLHFIRRCRELGFSLSQTGDLLSLWGNHSRQSADVKKLVESHINDLTSKIEELQRIASTLTTLSDCCAGDDKPDCPILRALYLAETSRKDKENIP